MTQTIHQKTWVQADQLADDLLSAIDSRQFDSAEQLANDLWQQGAQSLESLTPRGTLQFAAGDRWDSRRTHQFVKRLKENGLPEEVSAPIFKTLGFWAGSAAVPEIRDIVQQRISNADTFDSGWLVAALYALHLIGGPEAAQALREFQNGKFSLRVREAAARYLNQLGTPLVDPMFGLEGEAESASAEEVRRRDRLHDPYAWQQAAEGLLRYLIDVSEPYWMKYADSLSTDVFTILRTARDTNDFTESMGVLEPTLPQFMLRFQNNSVMVLRPAECFFPPQDVVDSEQTNLNQWSILRLNSESDSSVDLDGLSLLRVVDASSDDRPSVRRALKNWTSQLASLSRYFGKRRQPRLVFSMAAMQFRTHAELDLRPQIPFTDLVHSMFRSHPDDGMTGR